MTATGDRDLRRLVPQRAHGYEKNNIGSLDNRDTDLTDLCSTGAMVTTLADLVRWDEALRTGRILSAKSRAQMWTPTTLPDGTAETLRAGLGRGSTSGPRQRRRTSGIYTVCLPPAFQMNIPRTIASPSCSFVQSLGKKAFASILADNLARNLFEQSLSRKALSHFSSPKQKSSKRVTLSAFVHTPILPGPWIAPSSVSRIGLPSK